MLNNRKDVIENFIQILLEVREVNTKWHINPDGTNKDIDPDFYPRCILLMGSELAEAFEAIRKGNQPDSHLPQYPGESVEMIDLFIRAVDFIVFHPETEELIEQAVVSLSNPWDISGYTDMEIYAAIDKVLADAYDNSVMVPGVIDYVVAYCDLKQIPLLEIYRAKTDYNRTRADHKLEARMADGGKQF